MFILRPDPFQQSHRQAIDGPEGEDAADRMRRRPFPRLMAGEGEDVCCMAVSMTST
jgi:hypothetical protein